MTTHRLLNRRMAIAEMGKAGLAVVVFGAAACSDPAGTVSTTTAPGAIPSTTAFTDSTGGGATTTSPAAATTTAGSAMTAFHRVSLDFVSAYILYRGGEAALVDTGVEGSAAAIEAALGEAGLAWDSVGHVILTHKHPDHVGSVDEVMNQVPGATLYAGAPDIPQINSAIAPQPVGDGDHIFDLEIIASPGHTAGHICVLDTAAGILVAGDAMVGANGGVTGPDPSFAEDIDLALDSVGKLAGFNYEVALFGHGEPVLEDASAAVSALAEG
jgi:glyoxylase-like metal-dependent hydrolase (beta-lactamase superfamily II)